MLLEAEAAIVKRIEAILTPFEVSISPFPGDLDDSPKPGRKGQIFIGYKRSRFRLTSMQPATLEVIAEYELSLMLKDLRSHTGAYPLLDQIRYAVTGFIPLKGPSHKCYPVQEGFLKVEDKIWYYAMVVAVAMQQIEGHLGLYESLDDDVYGLPPGQVRPYRPGQEVELQTGTWRAKTGDRDSNTLDRGYTIRATVPDPNPVQTQESFDFSHENSSQYIDLL
ncbi:hypothetical protein NIES4101_53670 [Calothrix sp. NIES-4101]|nr:hypothetical protein NIES4101_53670 [Calothrix sp. NIES-4101]